MYKFNIVRSNDIADDDRVILVFLEIISSIVQRLEILVYVTGRKVEFGSNLKI